MRNREATLASCQFCGCYIFIYDQFPDHQLVYYMAILGGDYVSEPIYDVCCMTICPCKLQKMTVTCIGAMNKTSQLLNLPKLSQ